MKRRNLAFLALLIIGLAAVCLYLYGLRAAAWFVVQLTEDSMKITELEFRTLGLRNADVRVLRASQAGPDGESDVHLESARMTFKPWPFEITGVQIDSAAVQLKPSETSPGNPFESLTGSTLLPTLDFPMTIDRLRFETEVSNIGITWHGSLHQEPGTYGGHNIELVDNRLTVSATNIAEASHRLVVAAEAPTPLVDIALKHETLPLGMHGEVHLADTIAALRAHPTLSAILGLTPTDFTLDGEAILLSASLQSPADLTLEFSGDIGIRSSADSGPEISDLLNVRMNQYQIQRDQETWRGAGDATVNIPLDRESGVEVFDPTITATPEAITLAAPTLSSAAYDLLADHLTVEVKLGPGPISGTASTAAVRIGDWPETLSPYSGDARWLWTDQGIEFSGSAYQQGLPTIEFSGDAGGQGGNVNVSVHQSVSPLSETVNLFVSPYLENFQLTSGTLSALWSANWTEEFEMGAMTLELSELGANVEKMSIENLEMTASVAGDLTAYDVKFRIPRLELAAGAVATDLRASLLVEPPLVTLRELRADLLEGELSLRPTEFNLNDSRNIFLLDVASLSLDELMTVLDLSTTELTGSVTGRARMVVSDEGLEINLAQLTGDGPGSLSIKLSGSAANAAELNNIALQALADFQYQELGATLLYEPDGRYRISARIVGSNPNVLDGYPIALNPNIEGRLPKLFRAFVLTDNFGEAIIRQLKEEAGLSSESETTSLEAE